MLGYQGLAVFAQIRFMTRIHLTLLGYIPDDDEATAAAALIYSTLDYSSILFTLGLYRYIFIYGTQSKEYKARQGLQI